MATDNTAQADRTPKTADEVVALVEKELDEQHEQDRRLHKGDTPAGEPIPDRSTTAMTLDLSHKYIHTLPAEALELVKDRVERLALSHNPQISVPDNLVQCDRLRYLNIRWNQLPVFPENILKLHKLEILDISKNRITILPESIKRMTSLKFLAISRNKIARLPLALGDMPSLTKLKFDDNPIVFPPLDEVLKPMSGHDPNSAEPGEEKDVCQKVKKYLKQQSLRQRVLGSTSNGDEETGESNLETPRPMKRPVNGRFPIRPSISGTEGIADLKTSPSSEHLPPPIPQRSHARVASIQNPVAAKRPGVAPLLTGGNDISRSRSETASSSASLRQRRQGFVPTRKPTNDLHRVSEMSQLDDNRSSSASTVRAAHSRQSSSVSTRSGFLAVSSGGSSSGAVSPVDGPVSRFVTGSRLSSLPENRDSRTRPTDTVKAARRLRFTLRQLYEPITHVATAIKEATPRKSNLERRMITASAQLDEVTRLLDRLESGLDDGTREAAAAMKSIAKACVVALKSYGALAMELKSSVSRIAAVADGIYTRNLMFQVYSSMVEAKNVCFILGFQVTQSSMRPEPTRASTAWSSKTVTPTQPRPNTSSRQRGATILQSMAGDTTLRAMPPPPVPNSSNTSRTNTMTSMSSMSSLAAATPRSGDSFGALASARPELSRSNTMRSVGDDGEADGQFDRIFLKLNKACDLAAQALPNCRSECQAHARAAEADGQTRILGMWRTTLHKADTAISNTKALKHRLEFVKVNEPGVRYSREFWQHCDGFVRSWADLVEEVKIIGRTGANVSSSLKAQMRPVQKCAKDISKIIWSSPLYHQAIVSRQHDPALATTFTPGPSSLSTNLYAQEPVRTTMPATPLSAALGPAVQATVASTPGGFGQQREYFHDAHTARRRGLHQ